MRKPPGLSPLELEWCINRARPGCLNPRIRALPNMGNLNDAQPPHRSPVIISLKSSRWQARLTDSTRYACVRGRKEIKIAARNMNGPGIVAGPTLSRSGPPPRKVNPRAGRRVSFFTNDFHMIEANSLRTHPPCCVTQLGTQLGRLRPLAGAIYNGSRILHALRNNRCL